MPKSPSDFGKQICIHPTRAPVWIRIVPCHKKETIMQLHEELLKEEQKFTFRNVFLTSYLPLPSSNKLGLFSFFHIATIQLHRTRFWQEPANVLMRNCWNQYFYKSVNYWIRLECLLKFYFVNKNVWLIYNPYVLTSTCFTTISNALLLYVFILGMFSGGLEKDISLSVEHLRVWLSLKLLGSFLKKKFVLSD